MRRAPSVLGRFIALGTVAAIAAACGSDNTVQPHNAASITLSPSQDSVKTGQTAQFSATVKDANGNPLTGQPVTWTSSDTDAAPVSDSGKVSAILPGTATITATSGGANATAQLFIAPSDSIALAEGGVVGTQTFPMGDGPNGGVNSPVDGIPCDTLPDAEHYHVHLSLIVNGQQVAIPLAIGIDTPFVTNNEAIAGKCFYWLHTHDNTGIIHVEPSETGHQFTLGQFFDIWGEALSSTGVAGQNGTVNVYVDGKRYTGDPRAIQFAAHQQITLEVGSPVVAPPIYKFPSNY